MTSTCEKAADKFVFIEKSKSCMRTLYENLIILYDDLFAFYIKGKKTYRQIVITIACGYRYRNFSNFAYHLK